MKILLSEMRCLLKLFDGESLPISFFRQGFISMLVRAGVMECVYHGSRGTCRIVDVDACRRYFATEHDMPDLEEWVRLKATIQQTKKASANGMKGKKPVVNKAVSAIELKCPRGLQVAMGGVGYALHTLPGMSVLVDDYASLQLPPGVKVVGTDSRELFCQAEGLVQLVEGQSVVALCAASWNVVAGWLALIPNRYIHIGGLDLASISAYQKHIVARIGNRAEYYVPADAEQRLQQGSNHVYEMQCKLLASHDVTDSGAARLVEMIHHYRRCCDTKEYNPLAG